MTDDHHHVPSFKFKGGRLFAKVLVDPLPVLLLAGGVAVLQALALALLQGDRLGMLLPTIGTSWQLFNQVSQTTMVVSDQPGNDDHNSKTNEPGHDIHAISQKGKKGNDPEHGIVCQEERKEF